jgi:hypothetical protein
MTELDTKLCCAISPNMKEPVPEEWAPEAKRALLAIIGDLRDNGYWQAADYLLSSTSLL